MGPNRRYHSTTLSVLCIENEYDENVFLLLNLFYHLMFSKVEFHCISKKYFIKKIVRMVNSWQVKNQQNMYSTHLFKHSL